MLFEIKSSKLRDSKPNSKTEATKSKTLEPPKQKQPPDDLSKEKQPIKPSKFINLIPGKEHLIENLIVSYLYESNELSTVQLSDKLRITRNQSEVVTKAIGKLKFRFSNLIEIIKTHKKRIYNLNKQILEDVLRDQKISLGSKEYFRENSSSKPITVQTPSLKPKQIFLKNINEA